MILKDAVATRLCKICLQRHMSYYELAYISTVPLTTIMHIIDGSTRNAGILTISKLCTGFGMTLSDFFDSDEFKEIEYEESI